MHRVCGVFALSLVCLLLSSSPADAADTFGSDLPSQPVPDKFSWSRPEGKPGPARHATFVSPSMGVEVGYRIYLPPGYDDPSSRRIRYPVVYMLHGGRPGNENKGSGLAKFVHEATTAKKIKPTIYVFSNGGPVSHYNYPQMKNGLGEDVLIEELIPHIDETYRTIASREGRAIEGFSQGGRGTARIMLRHPELFCSAAPGGGGFATEKRISENGGRESPRLLFAPRYNVYDLATDFAAGERSRSDLPAVLIYVGTKDNNYRGNREYMGHLDSLGLAYESLIVEGVPHSAFEIYKRHGLDIMRFHQRNFRR
ncbi:MAG: alpha/beta hydrolase-fold protein [Planctomycetota bacterium]